MKYALGIDVGGMSIKCGIVDEKGQVLDTLIVKVLDGFSGQKMIGKVCDDLIPFLDKNKVKIEGIGIGIPGLLDLDNGTIIDCSNLHAWDGLKIKEIVETKLHLPVRITNDANAAAIGEATFGSSKNYRSSIMLTLGTGIGGGVIIDHKLFEGNKGQGTELGHSVLVYGGLPCGCGRKGCFEKYASASALMKQIKEKMMERKDSLMWDLVNHDIDKVDGKVAFDAEAKGDEAAKEVINQYVKYLSEGILNYINIFRPEIVILSGGVAKQGKNLTDRIDQYLKKYNYGFKNAEKVIIDVASVGYQSGIIGAACLFLGE